MACGDKGCVQPDTILARSVRRRVALLDLNNGGESPGDRGRSTLVLTFCINSTRAFNPGGCAPPFNPMVNIKLGLGPSLSIRSHSLIVRRGIGWG